MSFEGPLEAHPFMAGLDAPTTAFLAGCARRERFRPGAFLLREGTPADRVYLLHAGQVSLEVHTTSRGTLQLETLGAGDVLGLSWLLDSARSHLDARAVEPVSAFVFDAACLRARMDEDHDVGYALARRLLALAVKRLERVRLQRLDLYRVEAGQ